MGLHAAMCPDAFACMPWRNHRLPTYDLHAQHNDELGANGANLHPHKAVMFGTDGDQTNDTDRLRVTTNLLWRGLKPIQRCAPALAADTQTRIHESLMNGWEAYMEGCS
jgi:hypothetical protein